MTDTPLHDKIRTALVNADRPHSEPDVDEMTTAVIDALNLHITAQGKQHGAGSAIELGESQAEYDERVRLKTHYRVEGRWEE